MTLRIINPWPFLTAVALGTLHARTKYPGPKHRFVGFAGEAGEALQAADKVLTKQWGVERLGIELRQTAQMALRFATEGDPALFDAETQEQFPCVVWPKEKDGGPLRLNLGTPDEMSHLTPSEWGAPWAENAVLRQQVAELQQEIRRLEGQLAKDKCTGPEEPCAE